MAKRDTSPIHEGGTLHDRSVLFQTPKGKFFRVLEVEHQNMSRWSMNIGHSLGRHIEKGHAFNPGVHVGAVEIGGLNAKCGRRFAELVAGITLEIEQYE